MAPRSEVLTPSLLRERPLPKVDRTPPVGPPMSCTPTYVRTQRGWLRALTWAAPARSVGVELRLAG